MPVQFMILHGISKDVPVGLVPPHQTTIIANFFGLELHFIKL